MLTVIDFKEEISKYKPVISVDDVETAINDEVRDMMDLLQHITKQMQDANAKNSREPSRHVTDIS